MILKKKFFTKFLPIFLSLLLALVNPLAVPLIYAQEIADVGVGETASADPSASPTPPPTETTETTAVDGSSSAGSVTGGNSEDVSSQSPSVTPEITPSPTVDTINSGGSSPEVTPSVSPSPLPTVDNAGDPVENLSLGTTEPAEGEAQPTIIPGTGDSAIDTGNADSLATIDTQVNNNQAVIPGQMSSSTDPCVPPVGETECPNGVTIENNNFSDVADIASSSALSGGNSITGSGGDAALTTGETVAGANVNNQVNTNLVAFEEPAGIGNSAEAATIEDLGIGSSNPESNEPGPVVVDNQNQGFLVNNLVVVSDSGQNQASENFGITTVATGDALAYANLVNFLNTNLVGSNFGIYLINLMDNFEGDINLDQIWQAIAKQAEKEGMKIVGDKNGFFLVTNDNQAEIKNNVNVLANTGVNQANANGGQTLVNTGDAIALANVLNFANLNLVGTNFFFPIVNIMGSFKGNLLLPRPEKFLPAETLVGTGNTQFFTEQGSAPVFENNNSAGVKSNVNTAATSGDNQANNSGGSAGITTGDAVSRTNINSLVNYQVLNSNWFFLTVNVFGDWLGKILGWTAPDSEEEVNNPSGGSFDFKLSQPKPTGGSLEEINPEIGVEATGETGSTPSPANDGQGAMVLNDNQAEIESRINVSANTGSNQANDNQQDTEIKTGKAKALANLFDFINANFWGSNWFFGLINILGGWQGNMVFTYPDVTTSLVGSSQRVQVGDSAQYTVYYQNKGLDEAQNVTLEVDLPEGLHYSGDNSGLPLTVNGQIYRWILGSLAPGKEGSFVVTVGFDNDLSPTEPISFWSRLFAVHAAEIAEEFRVVLAASIDTSDQESNTSNNQSFAITDVYKLASETNQTTVEDNHHQIVEEGGIDHRQPILELSVWNNINTFIYPGDTIRFEIIVKNISDVPSYDTVVTHALYNSVPEDFGIGEFYLGTVNPGERVVLRFGMYLMNNGILKPSHYRTVSQAFGYARDDSEVLSERVLTYFEIRLKELIPVFRVEAKEKEEDSGEVLGNFYCGIEEDLLPYLLVFLLSSLGLIEKSRRALAVKKKIRNKTK